MNIPLTLGRSRAIELHLRLDVKRLSQHVIRSVPRLLLRALRVLVSRMLDHARLASLPATASPHSTRFHLARDLIPRTCIRGCVYLDRPVHSILRSDCHTATALRLSGLTCFSKVLEGSLVHLQIVSLRAVCVNFNNVRVERPTLVQVRRSVESCKEVFGFRGDCKFFFEFCTARGECTLGRRRTSAL